MNRHQSILLFLLLLAARFCFPYEVVLKNGKILSGKVVSENQELMILRDSSGIHLRIKKSTIDSIKTQERNLKKEDSKSGDRKVMPVEPDVNRVQKPKTKSRVYKKEDLEKLPELTILGSEGIPDDAALKDELEENALREKELEAAWNEEALRIDDHIQQARKSYEANKSFCDRVIPNVEDLRDGAYTVMSAEQYEERRRVACMEAEAAAKELENAQAAYEEFLEEARTKGIPPGWVDPERIRN
jgi:hypothetical protein